MERISELHMANYLSNFWGYGNWNSNFWFIGMEEGGGKNFQLVLSKIKSFYEKKFNHHNLVDNYEFQINCIKSPWNSESLVFLGPRPNNKPVKLQS